MRAAACAPYIGAVNERALRAALVEAGWSIRAAAKALGVSRPTVYAAMARLGVQREPRTAEALSRASQQGNAARWGRRREDAA